MSFFNDAQRDGLLTGRYICSELRLLAKGKES
mgnify:CR=1 FL=1